MPFSLFGLLLHPKTKHLSGIFCLATEAKTVPNKNTVNGLEWLHKLRYTQIFLSNFAARSCFEGVLFTIFKNS